jgi:hypothetical protein
MRHRFGVALRAMTARELLEAGIVPGMFTKTDYLVDIELGELTVGADVAYAIPRYRGRPMAAALYRFVKERGRWRLDLTSVVEELDDRLASVDRSTVPNWYVTRVLKADDSVWSPVGTGLR